MLNYLKRSLVLQIVFVSVCNFVVFSQLTKERALPDIFEGMDLKSRQTQQLIEPTQRTALEGTIDPVKYFVGPSDKISINIWISPPVSFNLTVTPEGTLIIPTVGEVKVSNVTLAEAKNIILAEIRKKYFAKEVSITLVDPRPIIVTITGNVLFPGNLTLNSINRVDKAIQEANRYDPTRREDIGAVQSSMSTRNIILKRGDGTTIRVDLKKYYASKDDKYNPYLREGDFIFIPASDLTKNSFSIYGAVNSPGQYEYVSEDSLTDAIEIASGFSKLALPDSIEIFKLSPNATLLSKRIVNIMDIYDEKIPNIHLELSDRIIVKSKQELREDYRITIDGEVKHPGIYPITKNKTKLSEMIMETGGFTEYASLKNAELHRRSVSPRDIDIERIMSMRGSISPDDSANYLLETELRLQKEIVNVDFEKLFLQNDKSQDMILRNGDYITIPTVKRTIYVFGQVISPGHIPLVKNEDLEYYINKCGGYTDAARKGDVKIIKAKTKQWLDPDETTIEEGDHIWIPKTQERTFSYYTTVLSQTASIFSVVVGMALVIIQLAK